MRRFNRLIHEFNFIKCAEFHLNGERINYTLEEDIKGVTLFAIVVQKNDDHFVRYVGRSSYGLRSCLDRIKTGSQAQETYYRLCQNILYCLQHYCNVSVYYFLIEGNDDRIADQIIKQINEGDWCPDWNLRR